MTFVRNCLSALGAKTSRKQTVSEAFSRDGTEARARIFHTALKAANKEQRELLKKYESLSR